METNPICFHKKMGIRGQEFTREGFIKGSRLNSKDFTRQRFIKGSRLNSGILPVRVL